MPADNGSAITQFEGIAQPSGVIGTPQPKFTLSNSSIIAQSCRVDFFGLPNSPQTLQIRARNLNGVSNYSPVSNSVTPASFTDTWVDGHNMHVVVCGGSQIGLNPLWNDTYFNNQTVVYVNPGTSGPGGSVSPAYPIGIGMTNQKMAQVSSQNGSGFGYLVNIKIQNPAIGSNGAFNANPYTRFCFYMYPTVAGSYATGRTETTYNVEVVPSNVSGSVLTFSNQTFGVNTFSPGSTGIFNRANSGQAGYTSNTANTITDNNPGGLGASVGQHILVQVGDQIVGSDAGSPASWVISPTPGVLTLNQWNRVEIPLGPSGWNLLAANNGIHYKWNVGMPGGSTPCYFCNVGFVV
jgi:hypothetical protein